MLPDSPHTNGRRRHFQDWWTHSHEPARLRGLGSESRSLEDTQGLLATGVLFHQGLRTSGESSRTSYRLLVITCNQTSTRRPHFFTQYSTNHLTFMHSSLSSSHLLLCIWHQTPNTQSLLLHSRHPLYVSRTFDSNTKSEVQKLSSIPPPQ